MVTRTSTMTKVDVWEVVVMRNRSFHGQRNLRKPELI